MWCFTENKSYNSLNREFHVPVNQMREFSEQRRKPDSNAPPTAIAAAAAVRSLHSSLSFVSFSSPESGLLRDQPALVTPFIVVQNRLKSFLDCCVVPSSYFWFLLLEIITWIFEIIVRVFDFFEKIYYQEKFETES